MSDETTTDFFDGIGEGAGAPTAVLKNVGDFVHGEIVKTLNAPDMREKLVNQGADPVGNTPEQAMAHVVSEIAKWTKVIRGAGIKAQ